ncbi:uncharacterized protein BDZ99DRAFT_345663, partial [Mytilinidion resinicola]
GIRSNSTSLYVRQQPRVALVSTTGTEKNRKPIDPPPFVELQVERRVDPSQHFLNNPYIFSTVTLYKADVDQDYDDTPGKSLAGTFVSSANRLKNEVNIDGCYFVFGDISVKVVGTYRLKFSVYEMRKDGQGVVVYLGAVISDKFQVQTQKDFQGLSESNYLTKSFHEQGMHLRIRKEPRTTL